MAELSVTERADICGTFHREEFDVPMVFREQIILYGVLGLSCLWLDTPASTKIRLQFSTYHS